MPGVSWYADRLQKENPLRRLIIPAALLIASACTSPPPAAPATQTASQVSGETPAEFRSYSAAEFYETVSYQIAAGAGRCFSPDGQSILISSDETGIMNAYALGIGGGKTALKDSSSNSVFAVSYFPADDRILVRADGGGDELFHVFVRETDGTLTDLTPGERTRASFQGWSEDGETFYVATNERDPATDDLYAYSAADYGRELVFENDGKQLSAISPDGRLLALLENVSNTNTHIHLVDLTSQTKEHRLITRHEGSVEHSVYRFTPDSGSLVYGTNAFGEFAQAWTYDIATGETVPHVVADWDVTLVSYSPTGRYQVSGVNADGVTQISLKDRRTGAPVALQGLPDGELSQICFDSLESRLAVGVNSDTSPRNVFTADLASANAVRLTEALSPGIAEANLVSASIVRYESFDGLEIPSIFYVPKQASADNPVPALIWVHGGPGGQSRKGYSPIFQFLANNGYAILAANNRGSSGYGKTFYHLDDRRHGEEDLQDIVWGRKYLESLDYIDASRVGVMGGSYGGFMVAAALAFEPEVFDVGINIFGVTNWVRTLESIPAWWGSFRDALYDEMGDPATDAERHRAISPLFHAHNIVRPMLVVQGANDPRVLQVESDELVAAIRENGVPVEYLLFPDEGHGFVKKENQIAAAEAYLNFLETYMPAD